MKRVEPVAVVGIGGLFPSSPTLDDFWNIILSNTWTGREPPPARWPLPALEYHSETEGEADRILSMNACLIDEVPLDTSGLDIDRHRLGDLDPLFPLVLYAGRRAWEDASTSNLDKSRVSVLIANIVLPTDTTSEMSRQALGLSAAKRPPGKMPDPLNRFSAGMPAGFLAKALGLGGGAATLDAACASSLYAIKLACDELTARRVDAVIAGGASRPSSLYTQMGFSALRALSRSGVCRPFDAASDGLVVGEGAGMFVLKRLSDALRDSDHIYCVFRGFGLSNDTGGSLLAPNSEGQLRCLRAAYENAGWIPSMVDLIECHGTATPVGDVIEFESMKKLWEGLERPREGCVFGSVKSNVGHLLTGAGAAGLMKVILSLENETLPPSANFSKANPKLGYEDSPFRILSEACAWSRRDDSTPRRAAVSAFGFGGINAHVLLEEWTDAGTGASVHAFAEKREPLARVDNDVPVAIVGMGCRIGGISTLREFQEAVLSGEGILAERPENRMLGLENSEWFRREGLDALPRRGAWLDDVSVPFGKYRISPREFDEMMLQQVLALEAVDAALENGGQHKDLGNRSGVYVGIGQDFSATSFHCRWSMPRDVREWSKEDSDGLAPEQQEAWTRSLKEAVNPPLTANGVTGHLGGIVASRVAREFRVGGPSFTVSAEENSGMRALEIAVRFLQRCELDRAVVCAVDLMGDPRNLWAWKALRRFSSAGNVRPFDEGADGILPGEGAVALVLKRLDDALRDGDRVYCVVRGIGQAGGGGCEAALPTAAAYKKALERAYEDAGVDPASVTYLETHGSAEPREDKVEAGALAAFFNKELVHQCALGSLKPLTGHLGCAAGLASVIKAALGIYNQILPPLPGLERPIPEFAQAASFFHAPREPQFWFRNRADGPRRAGVSAMSVDGNCVHVVLEASEEQADKAAGRVEVEIRQPVGAGPEGLFVVEADDAPGLSVGLGELVQFAKRNQPASSESLARRWYALKGRSPGSRLAVSVLAGNVDELKALAERARMSIESFPEASLPEGPPSGGRIFYSPRPLGVEGGLAFVFPGAGNPYFGMGTELSCRWPGVFRALDKESAYLRDVCSPRLFAPWRLSWKDGWRDEAKAELIRNHGAAVFGQVVYGVAVSDLLRSFGVSPQSMIGYSLGETACYFASRTWRDFDEMLERLSRSSLFRTDLIGPCTSAAKAWGLDEGAKVDWLVGVVARPASVVEKALEGISHAYLLILNTYDECVIGGQRAAVEALVKKLETRLIPVDGVTTVHCEAALPVADEYRRLHLMKTTVPDNLRIYSHALTRSFDISPESVADSIRAQAVGTIDFPAVIENAYGEGVRLFVEMGPGNSCSRMIGKILADRPHLAHSACIEGQSAQGTILRLVGRLICERVSVDLGSLYDRETPVTAHLDSSREPSKAIVVSLGRSIVAVEKPRVGPAKKAASDKSPPSRSKSGQVVQNREPAHSRAAFPDEQVGPGVHPIVNSQIGVSSAAAKAHQAFLNVSEQAVRLQQDAIALQMELLSRLPAGRIPSDFLTAVAGLARLAQSAQPAKHAGTVDVTRRVEVVFDKEQCRKIAEGSIAEVYGPDFAEVDTYPTRVRLPSGPLNFVDRITHISGERGNKQREKLGSGRIVTEHDVLPDAWYLDNGRIPTGISVEAGQADLCLAGYLGIDFKTRGKAMYRLLDATVTFHDNLPRVGDTIRYDIRALRFIRQADTYLYFFEFDGTVDGKPYITMRDGCAGFFTPKQLADGRGIVLTEEDTALQPRSRPDDWIDFVPFTGIESYDDEKLAALRRGDLAACFGKDFEGLPVEDPLTFPGGMLKLVDRVTCCDPKGGRFGLGFIKAEIDIPSDAWFLTNHFCDDQVMPGTLMYESCMQAWKVFLLRLGWVAEASRTAWEPVPEVRSGLRCRGQVVPGTRQAQYEITIKEIGYNPEPYCLADALMFADGRMMVQCFDLSIRLSGMTREDIAAVWRGKAAARQSSPATPVEPQVIPVGPAPAVYGPEKILAYSIGKPSEAFGKPYEIFDNDKFLARLPGPPYLFLDRIVHVEGEAFVMKAGGTVIGQYDVPPDAWYFDANRQESMPFSVILEFPLQVCGWYAAYAGSALTSDTELHFRNLDGRATLYEDLRRDAGTLTARINFLSASQSGGMIIQKFDFQVFRQGRLVYEGDTVFGFFSDAALAQQIGVRGVKPYEPGEEEKKRAVPFDIVNCPPLTPEDKESTDGRGMVMPAGAYLMNDEISLFIPDGGPDGNGFIRGEKRVRRSDWFFDAHFYQDPVIPGSLGLEAFIQLLKVAAIHRWGAEFAGSHTFEPIALGVEHTWIYRGQVIPSNGMVTVDACIERFDDDDKLVTAHGFLKVDGKVIYQMKNFAVRAVAV